MANIFMHTSSKGTGKMSERSILSAGQHDGLNAQRFTIFIVDHKLTGGRTDRTEDRIKSERVCREA